MFQNALKNQQKLKKRLFVVFFSFILIIVFVAAGYNLVTRYKHLTSQASVLNQQEFLDNTVLYESNQGGYAIRHYKDWRVFEYDSGVYISTDLQDIRDSYPEFLTIQKIDVTPSVYIARQGFTESKLIQIGNKNCIFASKEEPFGGIKLRKDHYIFELNIGTIVIVYQGEISEEGEFDKFEPQAKNMIASFAELNN
jgi:hypothetical protein